MAPRAYRGCVIVLAIVLVALELILKILAVIIFVVVAPGSSAAPPGNRLVWHLGGLFVGPPLASVLDFTIWANVAHGLLMIGQAATELERYWSKFFTDIPFILSLAIGIVLLRPREKSVA